MVSAAVSGRELTPIEHTFEMSGPHGVGDPLRAPLSTHHKSVIQNITDELSS